MQAGGAAALQALLAGEAEEAKPEFLKDRPKYHYYNQWMRQRLAAAAPLALPEPVILKLLEMDAGELDLLLQYPSAATSQVRLWMCLFSIRTPMRRSSNTAHCHSLGTASVNQLDIRTEHRQPELQVVRHTQCRLRISLEAAWAIQSV